MVRFLEFYYEKISKYITFLENKRFITKKTDSIDEKEKLTRVIALGLHPIIFVVVIIMNLGFLSMDSRFAIAAIFFIYWWTSTIWILIRRIRNK